MTALCVIPTYNEAQTIEPVIRGVLEHAPHCEVLVVDDGSPDGTGDLAVAIGRGDPRVSVLRRSDKTGLGDAYRAGFAWGLRRGYDAFVELDADLSHDPRQLPALLAELRRADLVIGSRYRPGGRTIGWPWFRRAISRVGNTYTRLVLGLPIADATSGYRAFRRRVLTELPVDALTSTGYCFQLETAYRAWQRGFRLAEVPITFRQRRAGASKMSGRIVAEALAQVTRWGLDRLRPGAAERADRAVPTAR